jgi:DNA-binding NarL/FixJ family response regulator
MPTITALIAHPKGSGWMACMRILQTEKGIQVVGAARTGLETIEAVSRLKPRILLLHFNLLIGEKINLLWVLSQRNPETKVLLIMRRAAGKKVLEVLSYGAKGYLEENAMGALLPKAIQKVQAGEAWIPRKLIQKIIARLASPTDLRR